MATYSSPRATNRRQKNHSFINVGHWRRGGRQMTVVASWERRMAMVGSHSQLIAPVVQWSNFYDGVNGDGWDGSQLVVRTFHFFFIFILGLATAWGGSRLVAHFRPLL